MNKSYYAIIPANVRYDNELTANAKLLYGEITALCNETGRCWATNYYFSELYCVSKVSISKWVKQLTDRGYIESEIVYKKGTKLIDKRYLTILNGGIKEKLGTPIKEKFKDNNTSINNTVNNKEKEQKESKNKYGEFSNVLLKLSEYEKLIVEWGSEHTYKMIKTLDEGIELKGYKYKSHYLAIRKWNAKEIESKPKEHDYVAESFRKLKEGII